MTVLVDTSVLVRLANQADSLYSVADRAVVELHRRGETLYITPQNLVEFRSVATRPLVVNGLGLSPANAETKAAEFETLLSLLPETPAIFPAWKALVSASSAIGKQVHDARLVAVCHVNAITHLMTFNIGHFTAFSKFGPQIIIIDPASI